MQHARQLLLVVIVACARAPTLPAQATSPAPQPSAPTAAADLTRERALIDESNAARSASDYATARAKVTEAVAALLARPEAEQDAAWLALLNSAGLSAFYAQDPPAANSAWRRVFDIRLASLPDEHPDLQIARANLALTLGLLGDLHGARTLLAKVLEVRSRTLPDEHPDLQRTRMNLAATIRVLGDLEEARVLETKVLEVYSRTLPDEHPDLQMARGNLAVTIKTLGDLAGARALEEKVLSVRLRSLPDDHTDLQGARGNLATTLYALGDLAGARALQEKVLEVYSRTLPDEHLHLQRARGNLANTLRALGELARARTLEEKVLEVRSRTLPPDHPELQAARENLAATIFSLGDLAGARVLQEKVLEVRSRTLREDHPDLQGARANLAATIGSLGDHASARALQETVLEVSSRTLHNEHPDLQKARANLAFTLHALGDLAGARALQEQVLEVDLRTLPGDDPDLQRARVNLAGTIGALGDRAGARALQAQVLEVRMRTLPDDHPDLQRARRNLASTIVCELGRARGTRGGDAEQMREREDARERCVELVRALCRAQVRAARGAIIGSSGREAEERCSILAETLDTSVSFASGYGVFEPLRMLEADSFVLAETTRGAAIASAQLTRKAAASPRYRELCDALRSASDELAKLVQKGTTSEEFDRARTRRESVERELVALARELSGGQASGIELDVELLAARLEENEAAVGFRRFTKWRVDVAEELDSTGQPAVRETSVDSLCAFVVRSAKASSEAAANGAAQIDSAPVSLLTLIDLGPIAPIEIATRGWREAIGAGLERGMATSDASVDLSQKHGDELRKLVFDPLLGALGNIDHVVVALDDVLHLVPLEALPLEMPTPDAKSARKCVGDRWRIETRATLNELLTDSPASTGTALVALGGASFNMPPLLLTADEVAGVEDEQQVEENETVQVASLLRGSTWERGFSPLTYSAEEARSVGGLYAEIFEGQRPVLVLEKRKASREALAGLASKARYLHIATHGWFAPESIQSWSDPEPLDKLSGLGMRMSGAEQVKGMSPMLLCGLALAGANLPENAVGRVPGLVTADELSTLDLSNCELAVLSACDTNVGERRAGQGVASLQKALQMAGARSVITSLWKVPDEATKELMLDFYRRMWVEKKPKWQALWEAKTKLREARDENGAPKYTTRDWAAWVLTGNPE